MTPLDRTAELMTDDDIIELTLRVGTILVPTDGSATAVEATKVAIGLAKRLGSDIVALYVSPGRIEEPMEYDEIQQLEGIKHSSAGLDVAARLGMRNGVSVRTLHREGAIGREILDAVDELGVQLIVMGTEGRTGLKRFTLGSVAQSVMKEARIPVLVVRHGSTEFCMPPRT